MLVNSLFPVHNIRYFFIGFAVFEIDSRNAAGNSADELIVEARRHIAYLLGANRAAVVAAHENDFVLDIQLTLDIGHIYHELIHAHSADYRRELTVDYHSAL